MNRSEAPRGSAFEWFVAWRHLRDPEHRSRRMLIIGLAIMVVAAVVVVAIDLSAGSRGPAGFLRMRSSLIAQNVRIGALIVGGVVGFWTAYYGLLRACSF